jgi:hypothetical protein
LPSINAVPSEEISYQLKPGNTTNAIYLGQMALVRDNVYLYDVQVSSCLVDAYKDYNCFDEVSFSSSQSFQNGIKRAVIKCCIKLKKTATETCEILKKGTR